MSLILAVLLADQALKLHIKTSYVLETGSRILGSDKFRIHFTENEGMAFGLSFRTAIERQSRRSLQWVE